MTKSGDEQNTNDHHKEFGENFISEFFNLWFTPEFERRKAVGQIPSDFVLWAAQVLLPDDGDVIVRFNEEVRGNAMVKTQINTQKGGQVCLNSFDGLDSFELPNDEINYGHVTVLRCSSGWAGSFNFLRGRGRAAAMIDRAERFYFAARKAHEAGWSDVVVDNLFSACELLSKSTLIIHMMKGSDSKSHKSVSSNINYWRKLGNIEPQFVDLFNTLSLLRPSARYDPGSENSLDLPEGSLETVAEQIKILRAITSPKVSRP